MFDRQSRTEMPAPLARTTPLHERSFHMGDMIVVNGYCVNRASLKARFAAESYQVHETMSASVIVFLL